MGGIDYRSVFEATDDALLICDPESGRIRDANARFRQLVGRDTETISQMSLSELFTPADGHGSPLDGFHDGATVSASVTVTGRIDPPETDPIPVEIQVSTLSDDALLVAVEPSRRSAADGADTGDRPPLSQLVDHTPDVMWMFSADWEECVFINAAYEDVFGRSLARIEADPSDFLEGIHPDDRPDVLDAMQRLSAGHQIDMEYRVDESADFGRHVWVQGTPIRNDAGEVYRVAGFVREITDRHERELELRRQRNLVENVPIGVFRVSLEGDRPILQANPALVSMLDADRPEDVIGRSARAFFHDGDLAPRVGERFQDGGGNTFETRFETLDGTVFWGRVTTIRQTDDAGNRIADGVIEDITPRKHRQRQLRVIDRILRHNIRNDVSVISGYATHLEEAAEAIDSSAIDAIVTRSQKLLRTAEKGHVVVNVLSHARETATFDIVPDIEQTVERLRESYETADIETHLPESTTVTALREIDLALFELVENSIVHHDGHPTVAIDVRHADDAVQIRISDDGPGIPDREYEILSGTRDVDPLSHGSGMGLWLVHWIVKLSGGDISFVSSGAGSTVVVSLPTADETPLPPDRDASRPGR